ncbi:aspartic peptidase domain-containing protein, partial [Leptodontidium sp. 2 PMI_412]
NVTIGGQPFQLLVDTGSSDTWVATTNFTCVDSQEKAKQQSTCKIPTLYTQPSSAEVVPGVMLSQGYASGEFVVGPMVLETVSIGGITVQKSQVGAVTTAFWNGDGVNGGLLGLSGSFMLIRNRTTAQDANRKQVVYDPVFQKMIQENVTKPFFSMSIDTTTSGPAGFLVFGGLPAVAHSDNFTTVPIIKKTSSFQGPLPSPQVVDYIVPVSSFTVGGKNIKMNKLEMVVDSGTFANIVPDNLANQINDQWIPPAVFDQQQGQFKIDCAATAPDVGVTLNGTTFAMKSAAAIQKDGTNCFSAWVGGGTAGDVKSTFVLGDVFMKSVVSVFDLGTTEMHFAAR